MTYTVTLRTKQTFTKCHKNVTCISAYSHYLYLWKFVNWNFDFKPIPDITFHHLVSSFENVLNLDECEDESPIYTFL